MQHVERDEDKCRPKVLKTLAQKKLISYEMSSWESV